MVAKGRASISRREDGGKTHQIEPLRDRQTDTHTNLKTISQTRHSMGLAHSSHRTHSSLSDLAELATHRRTPPVQNAPQPTMFGLLWGTRPHHRMAPTLEFQRGSKPRPNPVPDTKSRWSASEELRMSLVIYTIVNVLACNGRPTSPSAYRSPSQEHAGPAPLMLTCSSSQTGSGGLIMSLFFLCSEIRYEPKSRC